MKILRTSALFTAIWAACPAAAQSLSGTITAVDTGAPLIGVTISAVLKPVSASTMPSIHQSATDSSGNYTIVVSSGTYLICARPRLQSLYLDPCQWGSPVSVTIGTTAEPVPLALQPGLPLIVRVHDPNQLLGQAETIPGAAVSAFVTDASVAEFPLQVVFSGATIRDYGTVVPIGVPMTVTISSATVALADSTGASLPATPISFEAVETGAAPVAPPAGFTSKFPQPQGTMIHVYATALR